MTTIIIRPATFDEIETIINLQSLSISLLNHEKYNKSQIDAILKSQKEARYLTNELIFVAQLKSGIIVGFGSKGKVVSNNQRIG
ncbi:MAG: hypothetical protein F6K41_37055 [Symploca sp. SIO3E6]|nr:hypothetical protein [Caldora sp. SIO3E6]